MVITTKRGWRRRLPEEGPVGLLGCKQGTARCQTACLPHSPCLRWNETRNKCSQVPKVTPGERATRPLPGEGLCLGPREWALIFIYEASANQDLVRKAQVDPRQLSRAAQRRGQEQRGETRWGPPQTWAGWRLESGLGLQENWGRGAGRTGGVEGRSQQGLLLNTCVQLQMCTGHAVGTTVRGRPGFFLPELEEGGGV